MPTKATPKTEAAIVYPREIASALQKQLASGSWATLHKQEADPASRGIATENRRNFELVRPLPSEALVARMLDVAYVASFLEEEGRRLQCSFGYLSPEGAAGLSFGTFRFASPIPLLPASLAKLAPAAQSGRTEFGIWKENEQLVIWGLVHHGDQTFAIDLEHKPTYFSARILRAGTFTVHFDQRLQLLFSRDHAHFFEQRLDLLGTMRDRAGIEPYAAEALCRLARRMLAHGHGGTILVLDTKIPHHGLMFHGALTPVDKPDRLLRDAVHHDERATSGDAKREDEPVAQYARRRIKIEKEHAEALDFVARLTAVDGAVVLDQELGLLGAGATIQTPDASMPAEIMLEDPRSVGCERRVPTSSLGGNRHRSAICFCAQQEGLALALVASQDGDLSFFARRPDGLVHALRPYELGVGI